MWKKVSKSTPPQGEIIHVMLYGGVEIFAQYKNNEWWQPDLSRHLTSTPLFWKRMGT